MAEEKKCYIHNTDTRLSCSSCGRPICPKCMIASAVGYRCKECGQRNISHVEQITLKQYVLGTVTGLGVGIAAGYVWNFLNGFGLLISLLVAYAVGFCISRAISKAIGNKIGLKIQIISAIIVIIGMIYNPILLFNSGLFGGSFLITAIISSTFYTLSSFMHILAVIIAVWAAIRHFKF